MLRSTERFWNAMTLVPGLSAVESEWREHWGPDFEWAKSFLNSTGRFSSVYPSNGELLDIVTLKEDRFVAVAKDGSPPLYLEREQLIVKKIDLTKLAAAICGALRLELKNVGSAEVESVYRIGSCQPTGMTKHPVFLALPCGQDQQRLAAVRVASIVDRPLVYLCPEPSIAAVASRSLPSGRVNPWGLSECLMLDVDAELVAAPQAIRLEAAFVEVVRAYETRRADVPPFEFPRQGEIWVLTFDGDNILVPHRDAKGLGYIHVLMSNPGRPHYVWDLEEKAGEPPIDKDLAQADDIIDDEGRLKMRERFDSLREELEDARKFDDLGRFELIRNQISALAEELSRQQGIKGKSRKFIGPFERCRKRVSMAVSRAIERIAQENPRFAQHLSTCISPGFTFLYHSPSKITWIL